MLGRVDSAHRYRIDVADETWVVAAPETVAAAVHDEAAWAVWWPDLSPTVTRDRGVKGVQWAVTGALAGSMEIWLEPWGDGVVLHWYLRADHLDDVPPPNRARLPGDVRRLRRAGERDGRVRAWKRHAFALKDRLEAGREPGSARVARETGPAGVKAAGEPAEST
jgi:hypothetical protein